MQETRVPRGVSLSGNKRKDSDSSSRGRMGRYDDKNIIITTFVFFILIIIKIIDHHNDVHSPSGKSHDSSDSEHSWGRGREETHNRCMIMLIMMTMMMIILSPKYYWKTICGKYMSLVQTPLHSVCIGVSQNIEKRNIVDNNYNDDDEGTNNDDDNIFMMMTTTRMMMMMMMMMFQPEQQPAPHKWGDAAGSSGKFSQYCFSSSSPSSSSPLLSLSSSPSCWSGPPPKRRWFSSSSFAKTSTNSKAGRGTSLWQGANIDDDDGDYVDDDDDDDDILRSLTRSLFMTRCRLRWCWGSNSKFSRWSESDKVLTKSWRQILIQVAADEEQEDEYDNHLLYGKVIGIWEWWWWWWWCW